MGGPGCGGGMSMSKSSGRASSNKTMPKNWGGMKISGGRSRMSGGTSGTSGFGSPKVKLSFGRRNS